MVIPIAGAVDMTATINMNPDNIAKLSDAAQVELYLFIFDELQRQTKKSAPASKSKDWFQWVIVLHKQ